MRNSLKKNLFPIITSDNNVDEFTNGNHSMFIVNNEPEMIELTPEYKRYVINITDFSEDANGLHKMFNKLREAGENDILELRISSNGGFVNEGIQFHNLINDVFSERCVTVLDPMGYSMGALLFVMGDYRLVYETSEIMFHNYSTGLWGKGHEILAHMKHTDKSLKNFFDSVVIGLSEDEKERLYAGGDFWFNAREMCQRGIATSVCVGPHVFDAEQYLELLKRMGKEAKKAGIDKKIKTLHEGRKIHDIDVITPFLKEQDEKERKAHEEEHKGTKKKKDKE